MTAETITQHTPGPWEADHDGYVFAGIAAVGRAFPQGFGLSHDEATQRDANARLIAAAPALLDALCTATLLATDDHECAFCDLLDDNEHQPDCHVRAMDAAIDAATGRRP